MTTARLLLAAAFAAALAVGARVAAVPESIGATAVVVAAQADAAHAQEKPTAHEASGEAHEGGSGGGATIAKIVIFAVLVALHADFLRAQITAYLTGRIAKVREDLLAAQQTRETAARQLAEIDAKLKALPLELESLKQRGAEDVAAERTRIEE